MSSKKLSASAQRFEGAKFEAAVFSDFVVFLVACSCERPREVLFHWKLSLSCNDSSEKKRKQLTFFGVIFTKLSLLL